MTFRREYKMNCGAGKVQVVGSRSDKSTRPYLRIEDGSGRYVGSLDGANLTHLRNALDRALQREPK